MVVKSGWIKNMESNQLLGFLLICMVFHGASSISCGWPGKPVGGLVESPTLPVPVNEEQMLGRGYVPPRRMLSYEYYFQEGQVVSYRCHAEKGDVLRGTYVNRTCQSDGRWSGTRPWCDVNVAFGKMVTYQGIDATKSDTLMTDGMVDSASVEFAAECAMLGKSSPYFSVDLGESYPIRVVGIYGKIGEGMNNLVNKKVTLGTAKDCPQTAGNSSAFGYECNREQSQATTINQFGSTIRFTHSSFFMVDICEVVAYSNPIISDCGEPEIPAFAEVEIETTSNNQVATYRCRSGYELQGKDARICYGRHWEGDQPICVEILSTTTGVSWNSTDLPVDESPKPGMDPFQIVLIVVCVALAIGLIVALIVLLRYGRLNCCGAVPGKTLKDAKKKKPIETTYQKVESSTTTATKKSASDEEAKKRAAAMAAAEEERRAEQERRAQQERKAEEEDFVNARLAYVSEKVYQGNSKAAAPRPTAPKPATPTTYAELVQEPVRRMPSGSPDSSLTHDGPSQNPGSPIYAQVSFRPKPNEDKKATGDRSSSSDSDRPVQSPTRKSYIPSIYLKESPDVQMKQKALNDQLKEAVRISRNTDF